MEQVEIIISRIPLKSSPTSLEQEILDCQRNMARMDARLQAMAVSYLRNHPHYICLIN